MSNAQTHARVAAASYPRILEILPGVSTYLALTGLIWGGLLFPVPFGVAILLYDLYWLYRSFSLGIRIIVAYRRLCEWVEVDWHAAARALPGFEKVHHLVVIPTYGESVEVLRATLKHIARQRFPHERLAVVLGFECRDAHAFRRAALLRQEFEGQFGYLWTTFHPQLFGEVAGKSSNEAWAARLGKERLIDDLGVDVNFTTITTCDADSRFPEHYFDALTCEFLTKPAQRLYQPVILFYSNIWRVPAPSRALNSMHSLWQLAKLTRPDKLAPQSTYSMGLRMCVEAGYWDVDVIPEDSHMFFKLLFRFGKEVQVEPLYLPVLADAAEGSTYAGTLKSQFTQETRWAWGVSDIPYLLMGAARCRWPGRGMRWYRVSRYMEDHLTWPIGSFLVTFGGSAPLFFNHALARTRLGHLLPNMAGFVMSVSVASMVVMLVADWKLKALTAEPQPLRVRLKSLTDWLLLPVVGFVLSSIPGVVAHTRLLFGRYLEYKVTEKMPAKVTARRRAEPLETGSPVKREPVLSPVIVSDYRRRREP